MKSSLAFLTVVGVCAASLQSATAAPVMTSFNPAKDGFNFVNDFQNDVVPSLNVRTSGLCGGMSYSVMDYYFKKMEIPNQNYRPANRTVLQQYLYGREVKSLEENLDKWGEVGFNPGGARNTEFFHWGLQAGSGGRITELRSLIDQGKPAPLGLQGAGSGNHQIVAIGYDLGRYKGDLGNFQGDFKIFVYDPNYPGRTMTLVPRFSDQTYTYLEDSRASWRTYFVDKKYTLNNPPFLPNPHYPNDGKIRQLLFHFFTGGDDLRGDNHVNLTIRLKSGAPEVYNNINLSARWLDNYEETADVVLREPISQNQIDSFLISTTSNGGISGDNWNMNQVVVEAIGGGLDGNVVQYGFNRFTGSNKDLLVQVPPFATPGEVNQIVVDIKTGGDDLRADDHLNIEVLYKDGEKQEINNVNGSVGWGNNSENVKTLILKKAVRPEDIIEVTLSTTPGGGLGADNWNMNSVTLRAQGNGVNVQIGSHGYMRFTGDSHVLHIPTHPGH